jgi:CBS domain-containing protein
VNDGAVVTGRRSRSVRGGNVVVTRLAAYLRPVVIATLGESVLAAARRLRDHHVGSIVVTREGRPIGILTDRDLVIRVVAEGLDPATTRIDDVLTYDPVTLRESDTIDAAALCMREHGIRRLPIVDDAGKVAGIVTADDLLVQLGRQLSALGEAIAEPTDSTDSK